MDVFDSDQRLSDFGEADFNDLLQNDVFDTSGTGMDQYNMDNDEWFNSLFVDPVLNDKMMTDAAQPPHISSEHSYSQMEDKQAVLSLLKDEANKDSDLDPDFFPPPHTCVAPLDVTKKSTMASIMDVKHETKDYDMMDVTEQPHKCFIKQPTIILATTHTTQQQTSAEKFTPRVSIKLEPPDAFSGYDSIGLPPTPPGSSSSSDSEGSLSPAHSAPSSPVRQIHLSRPQPVRVTTSSSSLSSGLSSPYQQPLFVNPIPQSGILVLTEEEKRTLVQEGYPVPNKLPLTKQEEKNLKKIRRKIKNKISAQESRRKKKEYLEILEKRLEHTNNENGDLRKKVDTLESNNRSLLSQLQKLQSIVKSCRPSSPTNQGTCLMVLVLCFAVFLGSPGSWSPSSTLTIGYTNKLHKIGHSSHGLCHLENPILGYHGKIGSNGGPLLGHHRGREGDYATANMRSRVLLAVHDDTTPYEPYGPHMPFEYKEMPEKVDSMPREANPGLPPVTVVQGNPTVIERLAQKLNMVSEIVQVHMTLKPEHSENVTARLIEHSVNSTLAVV